MLGIVLLILAAACFFLAAINQTVVHQTPADLSYWGLLGVVLAILYHTPLVNARFNRE